MFMVLPFEKSSLNTLHSKSSLTNTPKWHQNKCSFKIILTISDFLIRVLKKNPVYSNWATLLHNELFLFWVCKFSLKSVSVPVQLTFVWFTSRSGFFSSLMKPTWQGPVISSIRVFTCAHNIEESGHENVNYSTWEPKYNIKPTTVLLTQSYVSTLLV